MDIPDAKKLANDFSLISISEEPKSKGYTASREVITVLRSAAGDRTPADIKTALDKEEITIEALTAFLKEYNGSKSVEDLILKADFVSVVLAKLLEMRVQSHYQFLIEWAAKENLLALVSPSRPTMSISEAPLSNLFEHVTSSRKNQEQPIRGTGQFSSTFSSESTLELSASAAGETIITRANEPSKALWPHWNIVSHGGEPWHSVGVTLLTRDSKLLVVEHTSQKREEPVHVEMQGGAIEIYDLGATEGETFANATVREMMEELRGSFLLDKNSIIDAYETKCYVEYIYGPEATRPYSVRSISFLVLTDLSSEDIDREFQKTLQNKLSRKFSEVVAVYFLPLSQPLLEIRQLKLPVFSTPKRNFFIKSRARRVFESMKQSLSSKGVSFDKCKDLFYKLPPTSSVADRLVAEEPEQPLRTGKYIIPHKRK